MGRFLNELRLIAEPGPRHTRPLWRLLSPLAYQVGDDVCGFVVVVPADFVTDLASVPRPFWRIVPICDEEYREPVVVHDWLCTAYPKVSRRVADAILYDAMRVKGCCAFHLLTVYYGVRFGATWYAMWRRIGRLFGRESHE